MSLDTKDKIEIIESSITRYGVYWQSRQKQLGVLVDEIISEIKDIEDASFHDQLSAIDKKKIKAIWVVSGSGTFFKPITDSPGDNIYKKQKWAHWSDMKRIKKGVSLIRKVSDGDENLPYLIYNGVEEQNSDLITAIESEKISIPLSSVFIPKGKRIEKTLDQVKGLQLPDTIKWQDGDMVGVVSHAPHLARIMRMMNKYKTLPNNVTVKLFSLVFEKVENEDVFAIAEIMGILGYISRGEASPKPYPYIL